MTEKNGAKPDRIPDFDKMKLTGLIAESFLSMKYPVSPEVITLEDPDQKVIRGNIRLWVDRALEDFPFVITFSKGRFRWQFLPDNLEFSCLPEEIRPE